MVPALSYHIYENGAIGLIICKEKNNVLAKYAVNSSNEPIAISAYELSNFLPENLATLLPSTDELESRLLQDEAVMRMIITTNSSILVYMVRQSRNHDDSCFILIYKSDHATLLPLLCSGCYSSSAPIRADLLTSNAPSHLHAQPFLP